MRIRERRETGASPGGREFDFLLACVRSFFDPGNRLPSSPDLDWPKLISLAERHAVLGLFCRGVQGRAEIPAEIRDDLQRRVREAAFFDLMLSSELGAILRLFEAEGIPVIALKGPALAAALYGDAALRSSTDLDLLVHPDDVLRTRAVLEGRGYEMESTLPWSGENACFRRRDSQMSFSRRAGSGRAGPDRGDLWVDLHWRLLPGYFPAAFDSNEVWLETRHIAISGVCVPTLPAENLLLFLSAHGTKHLWERVGWICDIARLLHTEPAIDWTAIFSRAKQTGTQRMVLLGLLLASDLLGVSVPLPALEHIGADPAVNGLGKDVRKRLEDRTLRAASAIEAARFSVRAFERGAHGLRFVSGIFVQPTEAEYVALKLPPRLDWLYYFFRPVRLLIKYATVWFIKVSDS